VRHVGIVVKNIDHLLPFYRDLLGMKPVKRTDEPSAFVSRILGLRGCRLVTVKLSADEGKTLIELLEFASHPAKDGAVPELTGPGITHIALTVRDLDGLCRKLTRAGTIFISPPLKSPEGLAKVAFCRDPAGNYLELVEELA
jgi:catechol 2,3-dioxygenase-like lactoylglutathione lyase family enzyme